MITSIATWLIARKFSEKYARLAAWAMVLGVVLLVAVVGYAALKNRIIGQDRADQRAEVAERQLGRTNKADATDHALETRDAEALDALKKVNDDAVLQNPVEATQPAGPVTRSVRGELRRQRAAGQHPPAR